MEREKIVDLAIEKLFWKDIKDYITDEPELVEIIDQLAHDNNYPIFKVSYPFSAEIFKQGLFHLPDRKTGKTIAITDNRIPKDILEALNYSALPLGILSGNGGVEVFSELEDRVFSLAYFTSSLNLGIWETFAYPTPFTVTAGARSLFMLPKTMEAEGYKRLKQRFGVTTSLSNNVFDQWHIFKEIINHKKFHEPWCCDIFFLTTPWLKGLKTDPKRRALYSFLLERAWKHTEYSRNKVMLDMVWESFSKVLTKDRIKPNTHIVDTLKHLIFVAMGALPAFSPAFDYKAAPIDGLLKVYLDDYELKPYAPSLMQPRHFSITTAADPVYYSLQVPTYLESMPKYRSPNSARADLSDLIELMDRFMQEFIRKNLSNDNLHHIYDILSKVQFDYFHSEEELDKGIYSSKELPTEDARFLYMPPDYEKRSFCYRSLFTRGCVRISRK